MYIVHTCNNVLWARGSVAHIILYIFVKMFLYNTCQIMAQEVPNSDQDTQVNTYHRSTELSCKGCL